MAGTEKLLLTSNSLLKRSLHKLSRNWNAPKALLGGGSREPPEQHMGEGEGELFHLASGNAHADRTLTLNSTHFPTQCTQPFFHIRTISDNSVHPANFNHFEFMEMGGRLCPLARLIPTPPTEDWILLTGTEYYWLNRNELGGERVWGPSYFRSGSFNSIPLQEEKIFQTNCSFHITYNSEWHG